MTIEKFEAIVQDQLAVCSNVLLSKGKEYAPDATAKTDGANLIEQPNGQMAFGCRVNPVFVSEDRLLHFKKAAAIMSSTPKAALLGMLSKHIVSVSDMCTDNRDYPIEKWDEKITDSINYLLILRAIVEEEQHG